MQNDVSASGDTHLDPLLPGQQPRSSPISIALPRRRSPNVHYAASTTPHGWHSEHQWSLFGQLMENEGHLGISPASISNLSVQSSSPGDYFALGSGSLSGSTHSNLRAFEHPPDESQSPGRPDLALHGISVDTNDYDSDDSSSASTFRDPSICRNTWFSWSPRFSISLVWRNVFKCVIAYFIASLFTFSPYLSRWIASITSDSSTIPSPTGHMVATM